MTGIGAIDDVDEHPIIFNDWSIRSILNGNKSQTRRIVKPQPNGPAKTAEQAGDGSWYWVPIHGTAQTAPGEAFKCPYGQPGDVLWVREGFQFPKFEDDVSPRDLVDYWVGEAGAPPPVKYSTGETKRAWNGHEWGRKRPSIYMPRELCRLRLRVENVRVERVKEIGELGAFREGLVYEEGYGWNAPDHSSIWYESHKGCFADLWEDIHGDGAWDENPWGWCLEFSRIES